MVDFNRIVTLSDIQTNKFLSNETMFTFNAGSYSML